MKDRDTAFQLREPDLTCPSGTPGPRGTREPGGPLRHTLRAAGALRRRVEETLERWVRRRRPRG